MTHAPSQRGFAFITAIFVLVILATFAAFVVTFSTSAQATSAIAVQGVRGYEAARAGIQWAAFALRDPERTLAPGPAPRDCFATPTTLALPGDLGAFAVQVTCVRFPADDASPGYHEEGVQRLAQYVVTATASSGSVGAVDYVERQIEARIEVCRDPTAAAPGYVCR